MKKIIDGLRYDTETAELMFQWDEGLPVNIHYVEGKIYKTKNDNWFTVINHELAPVSRQAAFTMMCAYDGETTAEDCFPDLIGEA